MGLLATDPVERGAAIGLVGCLAAFAVNSVWSPLLVRGIGVPLALTLALAAHAAGGAKANDGA